jgi:lysophospholipase L1-like esterase
MAIELRSLVGFGASTMQGAGDSQGGFFARVTRHLQQSQPGRKCYNLGVGGNTTVDMLNRVEQAEQYMPFDSVVILGCNDLPRERDGNVPRRTTIEQYTANLDAIFPRIRGEASLFVSSFRPDSERTGVLTSTMDQYMGVALDLARKHQFEIWDLYYELRDSPELPKYWANDGMHFNDAGHAMLADRLLQYLSKLPGYQR